MVVKFGMLEAQETKDMNMCLLAVSVLCGILAKDSGVREKSQTYECIFCLYVVETVALLHQNWFHSLLSSLMHQNIVQFCPARRLV